ncbi:hypothetical protein LLG46_01250 [bacterium]|nr:hypothetical protein [bacterium]
MISAKYYTPENVDRAGKARIGAGVVALIICGYLIATSAISMREIWSANKALRKEKSAVISIKRDADIKRNRDASEPLASMGGVESFALAFTCWAKLDGVSVESIVPEGPPAASQITLGKVKLGSWNANKVRVRGNGEFTSLTRLLEKLRNPGMPIQLDSFSIESADSRIGKVNYNLLLTVYEKASAS